jgi:hypothetical protein
MGRGAKAVLKSVLRSPAPHFVKIDVEGAEGKALRGFSASIERCLPTFAIDLHTPEQDLLVAAFLRERDYTLYRLVSPSARTLTGQKELLRKITNLHAGWGTPEGVWGTIVAVHPSRADA